MNASSFQLESGHPPGTLGISDLRSILLTDVLAWHGLAVKPEGVRYRAKTETHNIVTTGQLWFDNKTGTGGAGAIDLQMHLTGEDFSTACKTLAGQFRGHSNDGTGERDAGASVDSIREKRIPFAQLMAKYAARDEQNWPVARDYLVGMRGIEPVLVDDLHDVGSIYANDHRPNPALVFLHRTDCGKVVGASLRDTRHESAFRPCLGEKLFGWFAVGNVREAETVVAVESAIDALSYHTLFVGRNERTAVVSCSGSHVPEELMFQAYDRRKSFVVALDNDGAGERGWQRAWDQTVDWTGFKISSACPRLKDWNADLIASVESLVPAKIRNHSSITP